MNLILIQIMSFEKNPSKEVNNNLNEQKEIKITQKKNVKIKIKIHEKKIYL